MRYYPIQLIFLLIFLTSCSTHSNKIGDIKNNILPDKFTFDQKSQKIQPDRWWTEFKSDELNNLIEKTLKGNLTLQESLARLKQTQALAQKNGAAKIPEVSIEGSAAVSNRDKPLTEGGDTKSELASLRLAASYEIDLWGKINASTKATELTASASASNLKAAEISITAESVLRYFELLNIRKKLDIIAEQIKTNKKIEELIELRFMNSQSTALDVLQQREIVARAETLPPPLLAREALLLNELAVLVGTIPGNELALNARELPALPALPDAGIPGNLIERRPDVKAAKQRLLSAGYGVKAAKADRFPAIRLTASAGYSSTEISNIFDNWLTTIAGSILGPIIDGSRRKSEVTRTKAIVEERTAQYKAAILKAIRETEDALTLEMRQNEYLTALAKQSKATNQSYREAISRYQSGIENYIIVLIALRDKQDLELKNADAVHNAAIYRVRLYRALAGSISNKPESTKKDHK